MGVETARDIKYFACWGPQHEQVFEAQLSNIDIAKIVIIELQPNLEKLNSS
jgi:hypothetical protein